MISGELHLATASHGSAGKQQLYSDLPPEGFNRWYWAPAVSGCSCYAKGLLSLYHHQKWGKYNNTVTKIQSTIPGCELPPSSLIFIVCHVYGVLFVALWLCCRLNLIELLNHAAVLLFFFTPRSSKQMWGNVDSNDFRWDKIKAAITSLHSSFLFLTGDNIRILPQPEDLKGYQKKVWIDSTKESASRFGCRWGDVCWREWIRTKTTDESHWNTKCSIVWKDCGAATRRTSTSLLNVQLVGQTAPPEVRTGSLIYVCSVLKSELFLFNYLDWQ